MFYTYVIWNEQRDKIYIGHTDNLQDRLKRHNKILPSKNKSFTSKNNGVWGLVHFEEFKTRKEAIAREKQLKSAQGRKFIRGIIKNNKKLE
jgi:putative endonuclease